MRGPGIAAVPQPRSHMLHNGPCRALQRTAGARRRHRPACRSSGTSREDLSVSCFCRGRSKPGLDRRAGWSKMASAARSGRGRWHTGPAPRALSSKRASLRLWTQKSLNRPPVVEKTRGRYPTRPVRTGGWGGRVRAWFPTARTRPDFLAACCQKIRPPPTAPPASAAGEVMMG